jgi:hypothetical protein
MGVSDEQTQRQFTLWHECFYACITDRAPPGFELRTEFLLSLRPRRADLLLLRRSGEPRRDDQAHLLRGLWPRLGKASLVELKSPTRGFRRTEFLRLCGYGLQYHEHNLDDLPDASALTLVLIVPSLNRAFTDELAALRCTLQPLGDGYAEVVGFPYSIYVACTDEVAEAEQDDFLRIYSHHKVQTEQARRWLETWIQNKQSAMPTVTEREDYDEMVGKLLSSLSTEQVLRHVGTRAILEHIKPEERLAGLAPEERLAGLAPEERLAGLAPEERLAGLAPAQVLQYYGAEDLLLEMPLNVLRGLSEDYVRTLPEHVQRAIHARLAREP